MAICGRMSAPDDVLRLGRAGSPVLARLEIRDPALIAEIDRRADTLDRSGSTERRMRKRVIVWSLAATASLVLVAVFGVPALSDRIAPLIPLSVEHRLGDLPSTRQVRAMLDNRKVRQAVRMRLSRRRKARPRRARQAMVGRLETAAGLPIPLKAAVVRRREANAIALPGGHIYVFEGLVDKVAQPRRTRRRHRARDRPCRASRRHPLAAAGRRPVVSVRHAARRLHRRRRGGDRGANGGAVGLFARGRGGRRSLRSELDDQDRRRRHARLAAILERIAGAIEPGVKILLDHPQTKDRVAAIKAAAAAPPADAKPLLAPAEWAALKRICG